MRNLDKDGLIKEPCSQRYGKPPKNDKKRERLLYWGRWFWLIVLTPFIGIFIFDAMSQELTDDFGHYPWWYFSKDGD